MENQQPTLEQVQNAAFEMHRYRIIIKRQQKISSITWIITSCVIYIVLLIYGYLADKSPIMMFIGYAFFAGFSGMGAYMLAMLTLLVFYKPIVEIPLPEHSAILKKHVEEEVVKRNRWFQSWKKDRDGAQKNMDLSQEQLDHYNNILEQIKQKL